MATEEETEQTAVRIPKSWLGRLDKIAEQLTQRAFASLKVFKGKAVALEALAEFLLRRDR